MKRDEKSLSTAAWKDIKKRFAAAPLFFLVVALSLILIFVVRLRINANATGKSVGEGVGTLVGRAAGSFDGLTKGRQEGYEAGKSKGLSAEDTEVELSGKIKEVQRLQVLLASGILSDVLSIGDKYAALVAIKYNAVFTVDLGTAEIALEGNRLHILLDQPAVDFIPVGEIEKMSEYQNNPFTGKAGDGYTALNNAAKKMKKEAEEKLAGDASMMAAASASAQTQLTQLVNAVSLSKPKVSIEFKAVKGVEVAYG
jgi:hypothetical protein